jgi:hypothetical protein
VLAAALAKFFLARFVPANEGGRPEAKNRLTPPVCRQPAEQPAPPGEPELFETHFFPEPHPWFSERARYIRYVSFLVHNYDTQVFSMGEKEEKGRQSKEGETWGMGGESSFFRRLRGKP